MNKKQDKKLIKQLEEIGIDSIIITTSSPYCLEININKEKHPNIKENKIYIESRKYKTIKSNDF